MSTHQDMKQSERVRRFFDEADEYFRKTKISRREPVPPPETRRRRTRKLPHLVATNKTSNAVTNANLG